MSAWCPHITWSEAVAAPSCFWICSDWMEYETGGFLRVGDDWVMCPICGAARPKPDFTINVLDNPDKHQ